MMGKTHRASGGLIALGGYLAFKHFNMLDPQIADVTELITLYASSYYGSVVADNDHVWENSPLRDPLSWVFNKVLHLTTPLRKRMEASKRGKGLLYNLLGLFDARHRSWQTHSEIPLILIGLALMGMQRGFEWTMVLGFGMGYLSHAVMDMLSVGGWNIFSFQMINKLCKRRILPSKIRLVPKTQFFVTDGLFEQGVFKVLNFVTILLAIWVVALECYSIYSKIF